MPWSPHERRALTAPPLSPPRRPLRPMPTHPLPVDRHRRRRQCPCGPPSSTPSAPDRRPVPHVHPLSISGFPSVRRECPPTPPLRCRGSSPQPARRRLTGFLFLQPQDLPPHPPPFINPPLSPFSSPRANHGPQDPTHRCSLAERHSGGQTGPRGGGGVERAGPPDCRGHRIHTLSEGFALPRAPRGTLGTWEMSPSIRVNPSSNRGFMMRLR